MLVWLQSDPSNGMPLKYCNIGDLWKGNVLILLIIIIYFCICDNFEELNESAKVEERKETINDFNAVSFIVYKL